MRLTQHAVNLVAVCGEFALNSMVGVCVHPSSHGAAIQVMYAPLVLAALPLFPVLLHAAVALDLRG